MKLDDLPKPHEFWDRPPLRIVGDDDADRVYLSVGKAISQWESLEQLFAHLFSFFIDPHSHPYGATRAYGSIMSSSGRMDALKEAADVFMTEWSFYFKKEDRNAFNKLVEHFGRASGRRNDIGHGIVVSLPKYKIPGFFLVPPDYNSSRNKFLTSMAGNDLTADTMHLLLHHNFRYVSEDIKLFADKFQLLYEAVEEYGISMGQKISGGVSRFGRS